MLFRSPVFHVSLLKKFVGSNIPISTELPKLHKTGEFKIEPLAILQERKITRKKHEVKQVLVQWLNMSKEEATWEDLDFLRAQFPQFFLKDKEDFVGESNVRILEANPNIKKQECSSELTSATALQVQLPTYSIISEGASSAGGSRRYQ